MRAGKLDTPVTFQSVTVGVDGMGSPTETWANMTGTPTKAEYIPIRGRERIEADKLEEQVDFKLRIRRDTNIKANVRVFVRGETAKITSTEDYGRAENMVLWCRVER